MSTNGSGRIYNHEDISVRRGAEAACMYVIQDGEIEIIREMDDEAGWIFASN
ncbi:hypothetical protein ACFL6O_01865 [candidate division KSB1 bacterium]